MLVRGPLDYVSSKEYVCDGCGKNVPKETPSFLGRAAGVMIHVCSKKCFHLAVNKIEENMLQKV